MMKLFTRRSRILAASTFLAGIGVGTASPSAHAQTAPTQRVNLDILVLSQDNDVGTAMLKAGLTKGLIPFTEVNLADPGRPSITGEFLADSPLPNVRRAKFQAIILPNEAPPLLASAEREALLAFEREFHIRQLDAYIYPSPAVGMNWPSYPAYLGVLDGLEAFANAAALAGPFSYLKGPLKFEDIDPNVPEQYGYLTTPLPPDEAAGRSFTPMLETPIPGVPGVNGVLAGIFNDNGREEMILTASMNQHQQLQQAMFVGILNWLTRGVHFGTERHYLAVHIDDVFLENQRWVTAANCTSGSDCPPGITAPNILMTPQDVDYSLTWQQQAGLKFDLAFNGGGYDQTVAEYGTYPLGDALLANATAFRWINHTYAHEYLGCVQDFSVIPWRCAMDASGAIQWVSTDSMQTQINQNRRFARNHGLTLRRAELVTGEHSGLRRAPEEPSDNPNLALALDRMGIRWLASDNSRESVFRLIGPANTVPRYPMSLFYNNGTKVEAVDEYNWIYTSSIDGGSGLCENNPVSTCIAPLDPSTGFDSYIVPTDARIAMQHVLSNSPKPHFAHQSNLAEERILYPVLNKVLNDYQTLYANNTPLVNPTMTEAGEELKRQADWQTARTNVAAYVENGILYVSNTSGTSVMVPLTAPEGTTSVTISSSGAVPGALVWNTYGGIRTGWQSVGSASETFALPN